MSGARERRPHPGQPRPVSACPSRASPHDHAQVEPGRPRPGPDLGHPPRLPVLAGRLIHYLELRLISRLKFMATDETRVDHNRLIGVHVNKKTLRRMAGAIAVLTMASVGVAVSAANPTRAHAACTIPSPPANDELTANPDGSISIVLVGSAGATSYNIYRGTTSGGEATTPVANTTSGSTRTGASPPTPTTSTSSPR